MGQGKFERIDLDRRAPLGPSAVLLCGYAPEELHAVVSLLERVDAAGHRVVFCTEPMLAQTLGEALTTTAEIPPVPPDKLPRVILLSGMDTARVRHFLDQFASTRLPRPIFATVTPSNLRFTVRDLLMDLLEEHRAMTAGK